MSGLNISLDNVCMLSRENRTRHSLTKSDSREIIINGKEIYHYQYFAMVLLGLRSGQI